VLSVRAGFTPKTWCVGRVFERKRSTVEDLVAMEVRERHLRRRDEIQIPVAGNLEQILLELRQLPRTGERRGIDQERRLHFAIAVFACVEIEHEIDQRAFESRARAAQNGEARAGHPRRALEIDDAERRAELPVRLGIEVEWPRLAVTP